MQKGKTVIFNSIIHEICDDQSAVQVAYFYCKNNDPLRSTSAEIAKGLILQVLEQNSNCLDFIYETNLKNGSRDSSIYVPMLKEILLTHDSLYVGLDGLDECPERDRKILSDLITSISAEENSKIGVRTLVTSRKEKDLDKTLCSAVILDIKRHNLEPDIAAYVRREMAQLSRSFSLPPEREESIAKEICTRPQGMFLLARLIMDNLSDQDTLDDLNEELKSDILPHGIEEAYSRMLVRIGKARPNERTSEKRLARAKLVLETITTAKRGLYVHEIQGALAISTKEQNIDFEGRHTRWPLDDICGPIVQIHQNGLVEMIHPTAKDYLMQHHSGHYIEALAAEERLMTICTSYLTFDCFAPALPQERIGECVLRGDFAFQEYAVCYWLDHLKEYLHRENSSCLASSTMTSALEYLYESHTKHSLARADSPTIYPNSSEMPFSQILPRLLEVHEKIDTIRATNLDFRKRPSGLEPVPRLTRDTEERMPYLLRRIDEARSQIEARVSSRVDAEQMLKFYGKAPFRCPMIQCPYFVAGFETLKERERHYSAHQRSFKCTYESCDYSVIGLPSNAALELHINLCHEDMSHDQKFPSVKARSVERSLKDAIDANDIMAATALATEIAPLPEEERPKGFVLHALKLRHREIAIAFVDLIGTVSEINYIEKSRSAILEVCETGDEEILTLLLDRGGDPNMGFPETDSNPICTAVTYKHFSIARRILSHLDFEISRTRGRIYRQDGLLSVASKCGSLDILSRVLEADSEYYRSSDGYSARYFKRGIRYAIKEGQAESAKLLVRWALDNVCTHLLPSKAHKIGTKDVDKIVETLSEEIPEIKDNGGTRDNILQAMAYKGDATNVSRLLDLGADIDNDAGTHGTPLMAAASKGRLDLVNLLLDRGANIMAVKEKKRGNGPAALDIAAANVHEEVVLALLAHGASFRHLSIHDYSIGFECAECYSLQAVSLNGTSPIITRLLLENGAEVDAIPPSSRYNGARSPAQLAAVKGNDSILQILIEHGADVNFKDSAGELVSPLCLAVEEGHASCVRQLLSAKDIDINARQNGTQGDTALHVAIKKHRSDIVELLVDHGADVNAVNDQNESGLMIIMRNLWFDTALLMINKLIDFGARTNAVNSDGNNVFMIGVSRNDLPSMALEAFRILLKNGTDILHQNTVGKSALVLAAESNNVMVAEYLLQCLVETRIHNSSGLSNCPGLHFFAEIYASLQEASRKGHEEIVGLLLKFIDNGRESYGLYPTAVFHALQEAKTNVEVAQASASSEGRAKSYWDIYSMLLEHSR